MLELNTDTVCYIIAKAREFDVKVDVENPDDGSDSLDHDASAILEAYADDPTFDELKQVIDDLNIDEQCQLVALTWVGRTDFSALEWDDALEAARDAHTDHTALYLIGIPLLADYLEEGLAAFDLSCEGFDMERL
jgi:hypothetical protein